MKFVIHVEVPDDFWSGEYPKVIERQIQNAFDHAYPYARMETVKGTFR